MPVSYLLLAALAVPVSAGELLREDFESAKDGEAITSREGWSGFVGFPGKVKPRAVVRGGVGVEGSKALAVWHHEKFRTDGWGMRLKLPKPRERGVIWLQCRYRPPAETMGGFYFDARGGRAIVTRLAGNPFMKQDAEKPALRWHASWARSYWRLYTQTPLDDSRWHAVTARLDFDSGRWAAWLDGRPLGEDMPLCGKPPVTELYFGLAGTEKNPALLDDVVVSREPPAGFKPRSLLPEPKPGLSFRFAALGDPQLGFGGYETDKVRFAWAVKQVNRSGADLSLILGDMVHPNDDEKAYADLAQLARALTNPYHYVRGNHERKDYFVKHFGRKDAKDEFAHMNYSVQHKGFRFVTIDAVGNHAGLSPRQLDWIEREFQQAAEARQEIVICLHVSPWENNERGRGKYNQIGPGRPRLRELMKKHKVLLSLSGHYHRGLWHAKEDQTHYLVLGGTALVKQGYLGWCVCDVYPDRVEVHQKPLFFAYEQADPKQFHTTAGWVNYTEVQKRIPYLQRGPLIIRRHRAEP